MDILVLFALPGQAAAGPKPFKRMKMSRLLRR